MAQKYFTVRYLITKLRMQSIIQRIVLFFKKKLIANTFLQVKFKSHLKSGMNLKIGWPTKKGTVLQLNKAIC